MISTFTFIRSAITMAIILILELILMAAAAVDFFMHFRILIRNFAHIWNPYQNQW